MGGSSQLLAALFSQAQVIDLSEVDPLRAFKRIQTLLADPDAITSSALSPPSTLLKSAFISHAVKDEALIMPVMDYLRTYFQADLFLCADSIPPSTNWQDTILAALQKQSYFVLLLSQATLASHFCSFEIGVAYALKKPIILLSLDRSRPPTFIQHLQSIDVNRLMQQKPWLDEQDILLDELLKSLSK